MEVPLSEFAFVIEATGNILISGPILDLLKKIINKKDIKKSNKQLDDDVIEMQKRLFHMHTNDFAPLRGENKWSSVENEDDYYGKDTVDQVPIPPYDAIGLANLYERISNFRTERINDTEDLIDMNGSIMSIGGNRIIHPKLRKIIEKDFANLPFQFVNKEKKLDYIPAESPDEIKRVFRDEDGNCYEKTSYYNKVLVDTRDRTKPPFGPFVNKEGKIISDVILLSILPGLPGKLTIFIRAGYGGGSRLADILCSKEILEELTEETRGKSAPYLQAVFYVPANHKEKIEVYGKPELVDIKPLRF